MKMIRKDMGFFHFYKTIVSQNPQETNILVVQMNNDRRSKLFYDAYVKTLSDCLWEHKKYTPP